MTSTGSCTISGQLHVSVMLSCGVRYTVKRLPDDRRIGGQAVLGCRRLASACDVPGVLVSGNHFVALDRLMAALPGPGLIGTDS